MKKRIFWIVGIILIVVIGIIVVAALNTDSASDLN
ncbi:HlyD family secretion protein, partial [Listeria welshimeri]|nr:HlyD family secretion protein [Listeria welshimeri]